jgi:hypothetical protein
VQQAGPGELWQLLYRTRLPCILSADLKLHLLLSHGNAGSCHSTRINSSL